LGRSEALALVGAAALLHRRLTDAALRIYTVPADLFNLAFFVATLTVLGVGYATAGREFVGPLTLTRALLRFDTSVHVPAILGLGLVLASALVAYIPLTHMSHFIAKYFTYHAVRWDDAPNEAGGTLSVRIAASLAMRPTWSASHIGADGTKSWADIATSEPAAGGKR
jgi:nitrate reductase gamma subunit